MNRFQITDETWSYTNFSSSQASETKFGDSYCLSDGEEVDVKKKEDNCSEFTFAAKHETPKVSEQISSDTSHHYLFRNHPGKS